MSTKKHAVKVMIGGDEYTVRSDLPPEYTRDVAAYVDQALKKVLSQGPIVETHKAAILAALDITNELFQAKKGEREVAARLAALADDLAKLLPPGERKGCGAQGEGGGRAPPPAGAARGRPGEPAAPGEAQGGGRAIVDEFRSACHAE